MSRSSLAWGAVRFAAGFALLAYVLSGSSWRTLGALLATPAVVAMIVGLPVLGAAVESARLGILYGTLGLRIPFGTGFRVVAMATFFNFCIPGATGGDVAKVWYLRSVAQRGGSEIAAIWFIDRLTGLFSLLLLVVAIGAWNAAFVLAHPSLVWMLGTASVATLTVAGLAALSQTPLADWLVGVLGLYEPTRDVLTRTARSLFAFGRHPGAVAKAVAISLVGHIALLVTFVAAAGVLLPQVTPGLVCLLTILGLFANALPLTPGGLGVGESAFDTLFHMAGAAGGASLLLAWRIGMLPLCVCGCLFYVAGIRSHRLAADADESGPAMASLPGPS